MDDLSNKRKEKLEGILSKVSSDYSEGLNRLELDRLYERKELIKKKINASKNPLLQTNDRLQLKQIEESIDTITGQIDIYRELDLDVDEEAAKKYIKDNPDIFIDGIGDFDYD